MKLYTPHPSDIAQLRGDTLLTYSRAKYIWRTGYVYNVAVPRMELEKVRDIIEEYTGSALESVDAVIDVNNMHRLRCANLYFKDVGLATYVTMLL